MNKKTIVKKNILITGCSSGIGLSAAYYLRDKLGFRVITSCRKERDRLWLESQGFEAVRIDLNDSESIRRAIIVINSLTDSRLYALFNNAGYGVYGWIASVTRKELEAQFSSNLFGVHELTIGLLPSLIRNGRGRIIQMSSILGFISMPRRGIYSASKYALESWSDALRMELHKTKIRVSLIEPGPINTAFSNNTLQKDQHDVVSNPPIAEKFTLTADDVMPKLKHALLSRNPKNRYRITLVSRVMWYLKRLLPSSMLDWLIRRNS